MARSVYDEQLLTDEQKRQIDAFTAEWERANAAGDRAGMTAAHEAAERVRGQAGYSGGDTGAGYAALESGGAKGNAGSAGSGRGYRALTQAVNALYDAARDARVAALLRAYEADASELEAERAGIPGTYEGLRNEAAAQAEVAGRNFNEYAAASGLASGAKGQAKLAQSSALRGELADLGRQEAAEVRENNERQARRRAELRADVAAAVAQGEYERAEALLEELRREAEALAGTAGK